MEAPAHEQDGPGLFDEPAFEQDGPGLFDEPDGEPAVPAPTSAPAGARSVDGDRHDSAGTRGPGDLHARELFQRLADRVVVEVILATDPNTQGEATASYLSRMLRDFGVVVTRPASGLPVGGDLEYADQVTLGRAFEGRRSMFGDALVPALVAPAVTEPAEPSPAPAAFASVIR